MIDQMITIPIAAVDKVIYIILFISPVIPVISSDVRFLNKKKIGNIIFFFTFELLDIFYYYAVGISPIPLYFVITQANDVSCII